MRVLYMTNYPAPYRVDFFNELGKYCDLTVSYEERPECQTHRDSSWFNTNFEHFTAIYLKPFVRKNGHTLISTQIVSEIKKGYDAIIVGVYSTATSMLAIQYMIMNKIPYYLETDGGIAKNGKGISEKIKTYLIGHAKGYFSPSRSSDKYLEFYGADEKVIYRYPFTSLKESDLLDKPLQQVEKKKFKDDLSMNYDMVALGVGQFIHRKGWDVLIRIARRFPQVGFYIVGGVAPSEYEELRQKERAENVFFVEFKKKDELKKYYYAADFFVLPTREDIWGLVINEALSYALPVITTRACVAGIELVQDGENGYLVNADSATELKNVIKKVTQNNLKFETMQIKALECAKNYTIENMAQAHMLVLNKEKKQKIERKS